MSDERTIGSIDKYETTQVRVSIKMWNERPLVHVRTWERKEGEDDYHFTQKGVALNVVQAKELCKIMRDLEGELDKL